MLWFCCKIVIFVRFCFLFLAYRGQTALAHDLVSSRVLTLPSSSDRVTDLGFLWRHTPWGQLSFSVSHLLRLPPEDRGTQHSLEQAWRNRPLR